MQFPSDLPNDSGSTPLNLEEDPFSMSDSGRGSSVGLLEDMLLGTDVLPRPHAPAPLNPSAAPFQMVPTLPARIPTSPTSVLGAGPALGMCSILFHFDGRFCLNPITANLAEVGYYPNNVALINNVDANSCGIDTIFGIAGKIREPFPQKIASQAWYQIPGQNLDTGLRVLCSDKDVFDMFYELQESGKGWISVYLMNDFASRIPNPDGYPYHMPIVVPRQPPGFDAMYLVRKYYNTTHDIYPIGSQGREMMRRAKPLWYMAYCNLPLIPYQMFMMITPRSYAGPPVVPRTPPNSPV